jgi:hypothetical protein
LGPTGNLQGTYKFLSMLTGYVIQARSFTPLPMPSDVMKAVEDMAAEILDLSSLLPMHEDIAEDQDYVPEDHDSDIPLYADPIDPDELAELLDSMNQDPPDQGVGGLNQDHEVVADPIMSVNEGVIEIDQETDKKE